VKKVCGKGAAFVNVSCPKWIHALVRIFWYFLDVILTVTRLQAGRPKNRDLISAKNQAFCCSSSRTDRLWISAACYLMGTHGFFSGCKTASAWKLASNLLQELSLWVLPYLQSSMCSHDVHRDGFTIVLVQDVGWGMKMKLFWKLCFCGTRKFSNFTIRQSPLPFFT
jgi:hypothetical protein